MALLVIPRQISSSNLDPLLTTDGHIEVVRDHLKQHIEVTIKVVLYYCLN